jgi:hypothetical protein
MKSTLVKIIPEGMDPEFMVVTTESSAHEFIKDYAKDNGYRIEEHACANRFECILQDLERIRNAIEVHCPIVMKQPAFGEGGKPFNDELSQCFTNIEIACNEEMDDPELVWMKPELPTYEEYTKDMTFTDILKMYYENDIRNNSHIAFTPSEVNNMLDDPSEFRSEIEESFKRYLQEREYIQ